MGGEGDNRGWDDWMTSLTQWTWVWVNSGSWWWTGRPGMLQSRGSQRVTHDWETELNLELLNIQNWSLKFLFYISESFPGSQSWDLIMVQFSSVAQSCPTLSDPMNRSRPGLPVHHQLPEFTQTHAHRVSDAIQPSHPLSTPSPPAPNPSQHQGLFQWVNSSHEVAKALEFQLQHQSFQWTPRTDLL